MNQAAMLEKFRSGSVATASPARLVTMLYDRMVLDVDRGIAAIKDGNRSEANAQLQHAQAILSELQGCLDLSVWEGAVQLDSLYTWVLSQLMTANASQDAELAQTCRDILAPLRDAWHVAVNQEGGAPAGASPSRTAAAFDASGATPAPAGAPQIGSGTPVSIGDLGVG